MNDELIGLLSDLMDFLDRYTDVEDGDYGTQIPNRAMTLWSGCQRMLETLESHSEQVRSLRSPEEGENVARYHEGGPQC